MSNNLIQEATANFIRVADVWETAEVKDGSVHVDPNKAESFRDKERLAENRRRLRDLGWKSELTREGWILTPPAPEPEPLKSGASPVERARRALAKPAPAWNNATVADDGRTVTLPADRNPYMNKQVEEDLEQLRRANWDVGSHSGPRGVVSYVAVAPVEKAPPKTLQEALRQVPGAGRNASQTKWIDEGTEIDGTLVFTADHHPATRNAAQATAPRALACGWKVSTSAVVGAAPYRIEYPSEGRALLGSP